MNKFDVVVIGGGPAGMMAAGTAGEAGARVLLLEKNPKLGIKLMMTGNGRCNITNNIEDIKQLAGFYGVGGKFLYSAFHQFGPKEAREFFAELGVKTKVEENNRVLPVSNNGQDVNSALENYLKKNKVEIMTGAKVCNIIKKENRIEKVILDDGQEIIGDNYIIATGGKSYPTSGSSGEGYKWLKNLDHEIIPTVPALAPIILKENFVKDLEGVSLKNIKLSIIEEDKSKTLFSQTGDIIFTANGISGPAGLNLSSYISKSENLKFKLQIDLLPQETPEQLDEKFKNLFQNEGNKKLKKILENILPSKIVLVISKQTEIDIDQFANAVTREDRKKIITAIKTFTFSVFGIGGFDRAMVTAGGVKLSEVTPQTMKSKLIDNLYLAGEILDLDGPTGGFNLQMCWSTGYLAGKSAA
ncbi:MAG: NAD(P)/FAD-dependent oxidoreductase [Candidatus Buchananbacteria bacterium]